MTGLRDVLALATSGASAASVAARLGIPEDLAAAMLDQAERLGLAERAASRVGSSCGACPARTTTAPGAAGERRRLPLACAGCPLAR